MHGQTQHDSSSQPPYLPYLLPKTSSKFLRAPLLYGQGCIRSFSYISMVVQLAASMLACMIRKPARLTANALLTTTAMKAIADLRAKESNTVTAPRDEHRAVVRGQNSGSGGAFLTQGAIATRDRCLAATSTMRMAATVRCSLVQLLASGSKSRQQLPASCTASSYKLSRLTYRTAAYA